MGYDTVQEKFFPWVLESHGKVLDFFVRSGRPVDIVLCALTGGQSECSAV